MAQFIKLGTPEDFVLVNLDNVIQVWPTSQYNEYRHTHTLRMDAVNGNEIFLTAKQAEQFLAHAVAFDATGEDV